MLADHLACLSATDLFGYLSQYHDATIMAVLLGMGAAKAGISTTQLSWVPFTEFWFSKHWCTRMVQKPPQTLLMLSSLIPEARRALRSVRSCRIHG